MYAWPDAHQLIPSYSKVFANCGDPDPAIYNETSGWVDVSVGWSPRGGHIGSPFNPGTCRFSQDRSTLRYADIQGEIDGNVCGSSGGSGVAAFLSLAPLVLGTETGWSVTCVSGSGGYSFAGTL